MTPSAPGRRARGPQVATAVVVAYLFLAWLSTRYVRVATWDMRALESHLIDYAWQLELAFRAHNGEWSGRDFHFPMGPGFQLIAYLGSLPGPFEAGAALAGLEAAFRLLSTLLSAAIAWRFVRPGYLRLFTFFVLATLAYGAGVASFRSMVSVATVLAYAPREDPDETARYPAALITSLLCLFGLALSPDRLVFALAAIAVVSLVEFAARRRRRQSLAPAWTRLLRFAGTFAVVSAIACVLALLVGASPVTYVKRQIVLATAYGANLSLPWDPDVVSRQGIAFLLVSSVALGLWWMLKRDTAWFKACWLLGAMPFAAFVLLQTDAGHVYVSLLPLLVMLLLVATSGTTLDAHPQRVGAGLLVTFFVLSWFGRRPEQMWTHPRVIAEAQSVRHGERKADLNYQTDVSAATRWLRAKVAAEDPHCIGARAGLTVVHPLLRRGGPTQMALRWNATLQSELAASLRAARCPVFVYELYSFDIPQSAWFLGEDFFALAELYQAEQRLGPALVGLRLRETPSGAHVQALALPPNASRSALPLPSQLEIPLSQEVDGRHPLQLDYTLHLARWRSVAGGTPLVKWRFLKAGKPLADFQYLFHLGAGQRTRSYLSPEPEVTERRWLAGEDMQPTHSADTLELRVEPRGMVSPSHVELSVHGLSVLIPQQPPTPQPEQVCNGEQSLLASLRAGEAFPRHVSPRSDAHSFQLHPNGKLDRAAEVFFPVTPCESSCFYAEVGIDDSPQPGDGATVETHVIDRGARPLLSKHWLKKGERRQIEIPLAAFAGREVLLRVGSHGQESPAGDFLWLSGPQIMHCSARANISKSIALHRAQATWGLIQARDSHVLTDRRGAEIQIPVRVIDDTCASVEFALSKEHEAEGGMDVFLDVVVDGLRHRLDEGRLEGKAPFRSTKVSLHDFNGRSIGVHMGGKPALGRGEFLAFLNPRLGRCQ